MTDLRYPIGEHKHIVDLSLSPEDRGAAIHKIAQAPAQMRAATAGLSAAQLDTPYRLDGWTVRQVIHHVPDSHLHAYARFKWALTEEQPTIKPYDEKTWSVLPDSRDTPIEVSLAFLAALHERWVVLLRGMRPEEFARRLNHPEIGIVTLDSLLDGYAWHGAHHVAHITSLRERMGWR
jgi:hypothetical protein